MQANIACQQVTPRLRSRHSPTAAGGSPFAPAPHTSQHWPAACRGTHAHACRCEHHDTASRDCITAEQPCGSVLRVRTGCLLAVHRVTTLQTAYALVTHVYCTIMYWPHLRVNSSSLVSPSSWLPRSPNSPLQHSHARRQSSRDAQPDVQTQSWTSSGLHSLPLLHMLDQPSWQPPAQQLLSDACLSGCRFLQRQLT